MFHLPFPSNTPNRNDLIDHNQKLLLIGSCFADNIGQLLEKYKFTTLVNPYGTMFNPVTLLENLEAALSSICLKDSDIVESGGSFSHWNFHSQHSYSTKEELLDNIQNIQSKVKTAINSSDWLILTLGSSWAYRLHSTGQIVANCHRQPQPLFQKVLLNASEIVDKFQQCLQLFRAHNPDLKVILSVSPVRHTRDGLFENNVSKGILHQAVYELINNCHRVYYYEAYEIINDVLRDYRFFETDLIHPSTQAVEVVWRQFRDRFVNKPSNDLIDKLDSIFLDLDHRPFNVFAPEYQNFLIRTQKKLAELNQVLDVSEELKNVKDLLR